MSKEAFKSFVRNYPELGRSVMNNKTSWQKLYELYEMYGEDNNIWDNYLNNSVNNDTRSASLNELVNMIKNVDLNSVQKGVTNLQKTIGLLQDIGIGSKTKEEVYQPRPLYKYFDD